jgi:hypothetical protein
MEEVNDEVIVPSSNICKSKGDRKDFFTFAAWLTNWSIIVDIQDFREHQQGSPGVVDASKESEASEKVVDRYELVIPDTMMSIAIMEVVTKVNPVPDEEEDNESHFASNNVSVLDLLSSADIRGLQVSMQQFPCSSGTGGTFINCSEPLKLDGKMLGDRKTFSHNL